MNSNDHKLGQSVISVWSDELDRSQTWSYCNCDLSFEAIWHLIRSKVKQRNGKMGNEMTQYQRDSWSLCDKSDTGLIVKDDKASLLLMTRQNIGNWLTAIRKGSWWPDFQPATSRAVEITWNLQPDTRWDPGSRNEGLVLARSQVLVQHGHHVHENRSQVQVSEFNPGSDFMFLVLGQDQGWYDTAATPI